MTHLNPLPSGLIQKSWEGSLYITRGHRLKFPNLYQSLQIVSIMANSEDSDEMLQNAAIHQSPHCLQKYQFMGFRKNIVTLPVFKG